MTKRVSNAMGPWDMGMDSLLHPTLLDPRKYASGYNVVNRGGVVQTRPGFKLAATLAGDNLQGFTFFTPENSVPQAVVVVDGGIYHASYPYNNFVRIEGVSMDPDARFVVMQQCTKSVKRNEDDTLTLVSPYEVLVIQDGTSRAVYWDGSTARALDPSSPAKETPIGLWMSWTSSRLWVAQGSKLLVSDIADPLSFSETSYLAERSSFELPGRITGLIQTADLRGLLAFTDSTTTAFRSEIRDRAEWGNTADFQRLVFPGIGCIAGRSVRNHFGITHWLSKSGLTTIDIATYAYRSAQITSIDNQMARSKHNLSTDCAGACCIDFDNFYLLSVPSGSKKNAHTWVLDRAVTGEQGAASSAWASVWTGINPVEWSSASIGGRSKCYVASFGDSARDGKRVHIWEAFDKSREDDGGGIVCQMETGGSSSDMLMRFHFAEIEVVELLGDVNLKAYVRGIAGPWKEIADVNLQAEKGSIGSSLQQTITNTSILQAFKPQSRSVRTKELSSVGEDCMAETSNVIGVDKAFFILLQWRGRMGVRKIRAVVSPLGEAENGKCAADELGEHNIVTEGGQTLG